jgi:ATP-binding cassette, subfamily B, bacterial
MKKSDERNSVEGFRHLIHCATWAVKEAWSTQKPLVLGLGLVTLARGLFPAALALVIRGLIDAVVTVANTQADALALLLPWLVLGLALTVVDAISKLLYRLLMDRFVDEIDLSLNSKILDHAALLDVSFFEDPRFQDVIHRANQNTSGHFSRFLGDTLTFTTQFVQIASLYAVLATIEPLVIVVLTPIALFHLRFQWRLAKRRYLEEYRRATKRRWTSYFVSLLTTRKSVPEVKLLDLASLLKERFRSITSEIRGQNLSVYLSSFKGDSLVAVLAIGAFYALFANVLRRFLVGTITIGDVAVFGTVGLRLRGALETAVLSSTSALGQALYISNLREFLSIQPRIKATVGLKPSSTKGEIEFRNVSFTYPGCDKPVLSEVSFHIMPGETVALVGKNGAGKTTLLKLIARFYDPDVGSILFDEIDLKNLSLEHLHGQIAFVFQSAVPYEATAFENIAYADWNRLLNDPDQIEHIAHYAGVNEMIEIMPQGYDTPLGRRFGEYDLSDGQWQQIAIARAFGRDASVLILDEPTSNLDAKAEFELFNRFRKLAEGRTTILISHRFSTVRMADRIIVLDQGRIVESGTHHELIDSKGHYSSLYEMHRKQMGWPPDS